MNTQRLEKPGCLIVIRDGFTDIDGNPVTSVQIISDDRWRLDGAYNNRIIKMEEKNATEG